MAYASWSVVYGEQPTAAKWNILGTNDASFNDGTGIGNGAIKVETHIDNPYRFHAYKSSNSSSLSSGTYQTIVFDAEHYDINSDFDTSTGKYTVPVTGYYHFDAMGFGYYGGSSWGGSRVELYIRVNGANTIVQSDRVLTSIQGYTVSLSKDLYLTIGDEVEIGFILSYSSGAPYLYGNATGLYTNFSGHLVCA